MKAIKVPSQTMGRAAFLGATAVIAGCISSPMPADPTPSPVPTAPAPIVPAPAPPVATAPQPAPGSMASAARTPREYRRDAAGHLYAQNQHRIFKGKMPPLLYAIGVFEVTVDARGQVVSTNWLRAPRHAPEVMAEIERTARGAAPYPSPARLGRVTYTDTWLWDISGNFQLDTLTEGQF